MRTVVVGPVPDVLAALIERRRATGGVTSAALVVEIVSPEDETWAKLPFYAAHEVDELLIADPHTRTLRWLARSDGTYDEVEVSDLLGVDVEAFAEQIDWPPVGSR